MTDIAPPEKRIVRPATREDIDAYYAPNTVSMTCTAWIGEVDGKAMGLVGLAHIAGRVIAFFDIKDEGRIFKKEIARELKREFKKFIETGKYRFIFAECDPTEEGAEKLLRYLGFAPDPSEIPRLWRWDWHKAREAKVAQRPLAD